MTDFKCGFTNRISKLHRKAFELGKLNADEETTELWFFKDGSDYPASEFSGLRELALVVMPIIISGVLTMHFFRRLEAQTSNWDDYYGPYLCQLEDEHLVFWSVELFRFGWEKRSELKRIHLSELRSTSLTYHEHEILLRYESGDRETLTSSSPSLKSFANCIQAASDAIVSNLTAKPKLASCGS